MHIKIDFDYDYARNEEEIGHKEKEIAILKRKINLAQLNRHKITVRTLTKELERAINSYNFARALSGRWW